MNNIEKHLFKQFLIENRIRKKFLSYFNPEFYSLSDPYSIRKYLNEISIENVFICAFYWADTKEYVGYWTDITLKFTNYYNKYK